MAVAREMGRVLLAMNILVWNCRGVASKGFVPLIRDLRKEFSSSFMVLMKTHVTGANANRIIKRLSFGDSFI